ncbi:hypothetical protein ACS0TY_026824 [Phlomoides rotata]
MQVASAKDKNPVTLAFNVDHTRKKGCLSSAGVKWRQYKTTLTREYVYKRKTSPDLNIPPPKSGIDEIVWRDFVISRLSTNFMQMSDEHKKIVERNQLPHRLSRKGYARYALEHVETEELGSCSVKIQRSLHDDTPLDHSYTPVKLVGDDFDLKIVDEKMGLDNDKLKGKSVSLSLESRTDIVAYGTIIKIYDPNELIHGIKLPKNCMRVAIEKAVDESAHLPIPNGDYLTTKDAIGSHVAWPMNLMKLHVQLQSTTSRVISIPLDNDVFGHERLLYLNFEDVDPFCRLNPISYTCIAVYLWHLHQEMNKDKVNKFRFVDPYGIGYMPSDRKDQTFLDEQISLRARSLANRLVGTRHDQLVLAPCNVL